LIKDRYTLIKKIINIDNKTIFVAVDKQNRLAVLKLEIDTGAETSVCIEAAILKILGSIIIY
jgi:septum formation topological specificity factor MinE